MKLLRLINFDENTRLLNGETPLSSPYIISELVIEGYEDITSISNIDNYWEFTGRDYKVVRKFIQELVATLGYNNLLPEIKKIVAEWFAVDMSYPLSDGTITFAEFIKMGSSFNINSVSARSARFKAAVAQIYCRLGMANGQIIVSEISSPSNLVFLFIEYGRDGIQTGSPEGLFDYVQGTVGTSFEGVGLANKNWTPVDGTDISDVVSSVMDILLNGNY